MILTPPRVTPYRIPLRPMDAVVLEYDMRHRTPTYTVAAYWRQPGAQPGWRVLTGIEPWLLSRPNLPPGPPRGELRTRYYLSCDTRWCYGEAVVLEEVEVRRRGVPQTLLDIAWRAASSGPWTIEKWVHPAYLAPVQAGKM
ncbi:hypothetical protein AURDEDRAFT_124058 [Auricularia subglabra TFB-10046 SS5]|nr:hypothetical protein AURDEDRAFT_124058 [Auricularia subglabra TFB-10046 SS5]